MSLISHLWMWLDILLQYKSRTFSIDIIDSTKLCFTGSETFIMKIYLDRNNILELFCESSHFFTLSWFSAIDIIGHTDNNGFSSSFVDPFWKKFKKFRGRESFVGKTKTFDWVGESWFMRPIIQRDIFHDEYYNTINLPNSPRRQSSLYFHEWYEGRRDGFQQFLYEFYLGALHHVFRNRHATFALSEW